MYPGTVGPGTDQVGWQTQAMTVLDHRARKALLHRGLALEYATLGWNVAGIVVLAIAAISARSVALAGCGLDSLIEIGASTGVIWELSGTGQQRRRGAAADRVRVRGPGHLSSGAIHCRAGHRLPPAALARWASPGPRSPLW